MSLLRRVLAYGCKTFSLFYLLENIQDRRTKPIIPTWNIVYPTFIMALTRMGSFNMLEQCSSTTFWKKHLKGHMASVDEISWLSERVDIQSVQEALYGIYKKASRNKVFPTELKIMILDGHELFSSYCRCCAGCLEREITVAGEKRTQYYHRIVMAQLVGKNTHFLIDIESQRKGEDEVACAKRLILRLLSRFPRCFDVVTLDALYAKAPFINTLREKNKHVVVVLKDERRELYKDAAGLFASEAPTCVYSLGKKTYHQWDFDSFLSWDTLNHPIRVVRSLETTTARVRQGKQWVTKTVHKDWIWATTLPQAISTATVARIGHERWAIENQAFNHLRLWCFDHPYHHHPASILFVCLLIMIAFNLFHLMWARNFKPQLRKTFSRKMLSLYMLAEVITRSRPP